MSCGCNDSPLPLGNCNDGCADCPPSNATNLPPCVGGEACDEVSQLLGLCEEGEEITEEFKEILFKDKNSNGRFPILSIIDEGKNDDSIALIGLDSMIGRFNSKITQTSSGKGDFGEEQLKDLKKMLE